MRLRRLPSLFHEVARTFQDGKRHVPFIQVTDFWLNPERAARDTPPDRSGFVKTEVDRRG